MANTAEPDEMSKMLSNSGGVWDPEGPNRYLLARISAVIVSAEKGELIDEGGDQP